jgi:hypothetical protein
MTAKRPVSYQLILCWHENGKGGKTFKWRGACHEGAAAQLGIPPCEVQRHEPAHGEADDVRDAAVGVGADETGNGVNHGVDVVGGDVGGGAVAGEVDEEEVVVGEVGDEVGPLEVV